MSDPRTWVRCVMLAAMADEWLSRKEAARYLGSIGCPISADALRKRASNNNQGRGPSFTRLNWKCVKYRRCDLEAWAKAQMVRVE